MKILLKLEELGQLLLGLFAYGFYTYEWHWLPLLFFLPDISILGYLSGKREGAYLYNLFHHKGVAVVIFLIGYYVNIEMLQLAGIILFAHASFDRLLGYGLKHTKGFSFTQLGEIGRKNKKV